MFQMGLNGLLNTGNTCYFNSIIQILSHNEDLKKYIINLIQGSPRDLWSGSPYHREPVGRPWKSLKLLTKEFIKLIYHLWNNEYNVIIEPRSLIKSYSLIQKNFNVKKQQDAHEFLTQLLELLHDDLCNHFKILPQELKNKEWNTFINKNNSIITHLFYGQYYSSIHCNNCNHDSINYSPFCYINLPIYHQTLIKCLESYFTIEKLIKYKCNQCKQTNCNKHLKIIIPPKHLIIQFKRFHYQDEYKKHIKNNKLVNYPFQLNLSKNWLHSTIEDAFIYKLYGIIMHNGMLKNGHYVTVTKNHENNNWYLFDDSNVKKINNELILNHPYAYILFYKKI